MDHSVESTAPSAPRLRLRPNPRPASLRGWDRLVPVETSLSSSLVATELSSVEQRTTPYSASFLWEGADDAVLSKMNELLGTAEAFVEEETRSLEDLIHRIAKCELHSRSRRDRR